MAGLIHNRQRDIGATGFALQRLIDSAQTGDNLIGALQTTTPLHLIKSKHMQPLRRHRTSILSNAAVVFLIHVNRHVVISS
jgi:hypothetical protein